MTIRRFACALLVILPAALVIAGARTVVRAQGQPSIEEQVDKVFAAWNTATPGCAVGVASKGEIVLEKAYGLADLEHDVRNVPDTIFEAGSVSKQFTAAAVLLLAREGKLSLDDPVGNYIPELPDYGKPLLIRHMLTHTSGLRDWGEVEAIAGWPRTSRVYTHAHVLDIVRRQKALNFEPGTNWSYSNTGYNLAAIIVARVTGQPFAEFCRTRIFQPLGMTHTSWRDDFRRIVKGRAIAYSQGRDGYRQDMPFENVHGNGGLLTTVGDLLRWNENFTAPKVGDAEFVRVEQEAGRFNDGRVHNYALGLYIQKYKGLNEVSHNGVTAGYRAFLARYPDQHLSVAVLCNTASAQPERYAHAVADLYLGDRLATRAAPVGAKITAQEVAPLAGLYRNRKNGSVTGFAVEKDSLRLANGLALVALSASRFAPASGGGVLEFGGDGSLRVTADNGTSETYDRVEPAKPTAADLQALTGTYASDEAEVTMQVAVEKGELKLMRRPDAAMTLRPLYKDAFALATGGMVVFRRDAKGKVVAFSIVLDRVWDMPFALQPEGRRTN